MMRQLVEVIRSIEPQVVECGSERVLFLTDMALERAASLQG